LSVYRLTKIFFRPRLKSGDAIYQNHSLPNAIPFFKGFLVSIHWDTDGTGFTTDSNWENRKLAGVIVSGDAASPKGECAAPGAFFPITKGGRLPNRRRGVVIHLLRRGPSQPQGKANFSFRVSKVISVLFKPVWTRRKDGNKVENRKKKTATKSVACLNGQGTCRFHDEKDFCRNDFRERPQRKVSWHRPARPGFSFGPSRKNHLSGYESMQSPQIRRGSQPRLLDQQKQFSGRSEDIKGHSSSFETVYQRWEHPIR